MLVKFTSSETGELLMFADAAHQLLTAAGKECTARGTFTPEQMMPAAAALRRAVEAGKGGAGGDDDETPEKERPIALGQRAWPLIEMLERTATKGGEHANIVWEAPKDF